MTNEANELMEKALEIGFLTGSQLYGTATEKSDYDVVFSIEDSDKIHELIHAYDKKQSDYFSGFFIKVDDIQINFIPVHPHDFLPWYLASRATAFTLTRSRITSAIKKYAIFSGMVALFKGTVEERGTLDNYKSVKEDILAMEKVDRHYFIGRRRL